MKHLSLVLLLLLFGFGFNSTIRAQVTLRGQLRDSASSEPLPFAPFALKGTTRGGLTDQFGRYVIKADRLPATLVFSMLGYKTQEVRISDTATRIITMRPSVRELQEVVISSERIRILNENDYFAYLDFTFYNEQILALAVRPNGKTELQLLDTDGKVLKKLPVKKTAESLFTDCLGAVHLVTPDSTFQVYYDYTKLQLLYPSGKATFDKVMRPCKCRIADYYYFSWPAYRGLKVNFYYADWYRKGELKPFYTASDSAKIAGFQANYNLDYFLALRRVRPFPNPRYTVPYSYLVSHLDSFRLTEPLSQADARWLTPIDAPIYAAGKQAFVFNYADTSILRFSKTGELEKRLPFEQARSVNLKKEVLVDEFTGHLYTWEEVNGHSVFSRIDPETGKITSQFELDDRTYISKPKLRNGVLYFLWRDTRAELPRKINRMVVLD